MKKSELVMTASASLEEEIKKELEVEDPKSLKSALASLTPKDIDLIWDSDTEIKNETVATKEQLDALDKAISTIRKF